MIFCLGFEELLRRRIECKGLHGFPTEDAPRVGSGSQQGKEEWRRWGNKRGSPLHLPVKFFRTVSWVKASSLCIPIRSPTHIFTCFKSPFSKFGTSQSVFLSFSLHSSSISFHTCLTQLGRATICSTTYIANTALTHSLHTRGNLHFSTRMIVFQKPSRKFSEPFPRKTTT